MPQTHHLNLPYLAAAQSQKHVTHNEALRALDAVVQLAVVDRDLAAPPVSPAEGDRYIVAPSPTGTWSGHAGQIAAFQDGAWMFYAANEGWLAWVGDENKLYVHDGATWSEVTTGGGGGGANLSIANHTGTGLDLVSDSGSDATVPAATTILAGLLTATDKAKIDGISAGADVTPTALQSRSMVGINATADTINRLSVSSPASLFNHEGAGHQAKINKSSAADTASFLFQTAFSGRAEMGLTGDDDFHFKVSADGASWSEALVVDRVTGNVNFPVKATGTGTVPPGGAAGQVLKKSSGADYAYAWAADATGGGGLGDGDYGDITVSSGGSTWVIDNDAVTYAKLQDISATSRILGRKSAGAGNAEELTLSEVLDLVGSVAQGDIIYRGPTSWDRLPAGASGQFLKSLGTGANPAWDTPAGAGAGFLPAVPYSGRYRAPQITAMGSVTLTANRLYHIPIYLPAMSITEAVFYVVTAAAGASVRLGLRNMNAATGAVTTLVADFGTVSVATTGKKTITGLSVAVGEGWYFYDIVSDGAPVTRGSTSNAAPLVLGASFDASVHAVAHLHRAFTYAALPSDETSETQSTNDGTVLMPIAGVK